MACASWFGQPPARVGPKGVSDVPVDPSEVKPFRVEMASAPALHLGVLGVERIGHDFEKGFETGNAAHLFRRSRSCAVQTCGETGRVFEGQPLLDFHNVTPVVAEIVCVDELHARIATEVRNVTSRSSNKLGLSSNATSSTSGSPYRSPPMRNS